MEFSYFCGSLECDDMKFKESEFSIENLEKEIAKQRFNLKSDNSSYICPICNLPFYVERICESGFDEINARIIPHPPTMTIPRK